LNEKVAAHNAAEDALMQAIGAKEKDIAANESGLSRMATIEEIIKGFELVVSKATAEADEKDTNHDSAANGSAEIMPAAIKTKFVLTLQFLVFIHIAVKLLF